MSSPPNPLPQKTSAASLRVGINCVQHDPRSVGGLNSYALGLLEGFAAAGNGHRFRLYVAPENQHCFERLEGRDNFTLVPIGDPLFTAKKQICRASLLSGNSGFYGSASNFAFRNLRKRMDAESDIVYTPTVVLQWFNSSKPSVLSMHDIQQVHHPEFFSWARRLSRKITYGLSARHADYLQASSDFIKHDLISHFRGLSPERIEVIPSGVSIEKFAAPTAAVEVLERYGLPERFLFFPAQLWPHKNHMTVLKALKRIETERGLKIPLVLTGAKFAAAPAIFAFIAENSMNYVRYLGVVPAGDMAALYQQAALMVMATLHESSSLPVLESAAAGTPILASRIPPLEELGRSLELNLFDPLDDVELARLILRLWSDEKTISAQAAANRRQVKLFSWENTARKYLRFFERIVNS